MNISGEATASVRASRSSSPGARSSRCATSAGGTPARRATSSTNWLSTSSHPRRSATNRATSEPPDPYCRVTVMTGGAISGLQVFAQLAHVEERDAAFGRHEDDQVAGVLHVVQHLDPLLHERLRRQRLIQEPLLLGLPPRTPLRMAFRTAPRICSSSPISVKILGDCWGSICHRIETSTVVPICSLDSAAICSIWSLRGGHCSSRVE